MEVQIQSTFDTQRRLDKLQSLVTQEYSIQVQRDLHEFSIYVVQKCSKTIQFFTDS